MYRFEPGVDPATVTQNGILNAFDTATKSTTIIDDVVPLGTGKYSWKVELAPATYNLGLNDGSDFKQTAPVEIVAPKDGETPKPPGKTPYQLHQFHQLQLYLFHPFQPVNQQNCKYHLYTLFSFSI